MDLKAQISSLAELQKIDTEIYALKAEKALKPQEVKALEAEFEGKKQKLAEQEKSAQDLLKQRKDKELELATKEEGVKKLQGQLYSLKTNKEYQAMLQQIQDAKADASLVEDRILELLEQSEKSKQDAEKEKEKLKTEEQHFNAQKKEVEVKIKQIDERLAQLDAERARAVPNIELKILRQYERILVNRDGMAIAAVKDNACRGCNMSVPPQVINLIKMYERIITCEVCNRILYMPDEVV